MKAITRFIVLMLAIAILSAFAAGCAEPAENGGETSTATDSEAIVEDSSEESESKAEPDENEGGENGGAENEDEKENSDGSGNGEVSKFPDGYSDWYPPASNQ